MSKRSRVDVIVQHISSCPDFVWNYAHKIFCCKNAIKSVGFETVENVQHHMPADFYVSKGTKGSE